MTSLTERVDTTVQVNSVTDMTSSSTLSCVFFDLGVDTTLVPVDVAPVVDALAPPVAPTPAVIYVAPAPVIPVDLLEPPVVASAPRFSKRSWEQLAVSVLVHERSVARPRAVDRGRNS